MFNADDGEGQGVKLKRGECLDARAGFQSQGTVSRVGTRDVGCYAVPLETCFALFEDWMERERERRAEKEKEIPDFRFP